MEEASEGTIVGVGKVVVLAAAITAHVLATICSTTYKIDSCSKLNDAL